MAHSHKELLKGTWTDVNGVRMYARISVVPVPPDAASVVLVHGLSVSSGYMVPTAIQLAPYYRVYVPDLPGFGKSAKPAHIFSVPELADALAAWMETMKLSSAILLGNSLGCQIIVNFALKYPERITYAILVGPTMDPKARSIHQAVFRLLRDSPCEPISYLPVLVREYLAAGIRRTVRTLQYAFADQMEENLPRMRIPTLIVRGSLDPIVPQDWAEEVQRSLPGSRLIVVDGVGHAVNFNAPKRLVDITRSFLQDKHHQNMTYD